MATPKRFQRLRAVLDRRQPDLTVLMEDVQVPRNLAAVLRSWPEIAAQCRRRRLPYPTLGADGEILGQLPR